MRPLLHEACSKKIVNGNHRLFIREPPTGSPEEDVVLMAIADVAAMGVLISKREMANGPGVDEGRGASFGHRQS
jgi:hypothetical protein